MHIKGRAWTFGRNINTDLIYPKLWFRPTYEPGEMASHLMAGIDEEFPKKVKRGDVIVGGRNFGCGSSREEAAAAMKEAGIGAVVAPSFGRIYTRNCINVGLPIVVSPGIDEHVTQGAQRRPRMSLIQRRTAGCVQRACTANSPAPRPAIRPKTAPAIRPALPG